MHYICGLTHLPELVRAESAPVTRITLPYNIRHKLIRERPDTSAALDRFPPYSSTTFSA